MSEKLGIEKLKVALKFVIELGEAFEKKLDDGKLTWLEGVSLIPKFKDVPFIITNAGAIKAEFLDLDESEKAEIVQFIKDELDLENDKIEGFIETCLDTIVGLGKVVESISSLKSVGGGGPSGDPDPKP